MNIMQHIKDFFADAKKRNIFISCAAAVVIIAVAVPVGLALYGNNTSPVSSVTSSREKIDGVSSNASASQGSGASSEKNSSSKPGKENSSDKTSSGDKKDNSSGSSSKASGESSKSGTSSSPSKPGVSSPSPNSGSSRPASNGTSGGGTSGGNGGGSSSNSGGNKPVSSATPTPAPDPKPTPQPEPEPQPQPGPEPQPEIIDQNALISYGISYGQSRGMIYTPSLPSEIHGYDPPSDFMLWVTSMEEAKAKVRECIDCTVDNILSLEPGTSPSDIRFYVCFNSSNQFVVMYG